MISKIEIDLLSLALNQRSFVHIILKTIGVSWNRLGKCISCSIYKWKRKTAARARAFIQLVSINRTNHVSNWLAAASNFGYTKIFSLTKWLITKNGISLDITAHAYMNLYMYTQKHSPSPQWWIFAFIIRVLDETKCVYVCVRRPMCSRTCIYICNRINRAFLPANHHRTCAKSTEFTQCEAINIGEAQTPRASSGSLSLSVDVYECVYMMAASLCSNNN